MHVCSKITVCARDCYDTCALVATLDESGRLLSITGDPDHPITQGFPCPRSAKDPQRLTTNRITTPHVRQGTSFTPISWDDALDLIVHKLQNTLTMYGPSAALSLVYAGNCGLLTGTFSQRLWHALGVTQTDSALCTKSGHTGLALHYGESYGLTPDELPTQKLIVFWGFNAAVSAPHIWALARKARQDNGAQIVVIDPIRTKTAEQADRWIRPRPASDIALAYGVINALFERDAVNWDFLRTWTLGVDALQTEARKWTPAAVEQTTGVAEASLRQLVELYATQRPSATMIGIGLQKRDYGADYVRAIAFIPPLLGLHRGFFYSNGKLFPINDAVLSGEALTATPSPITSQVGLAETVNQGQFKFITIMCMNPARTLPNQQVFRAGLRREDVFVVVHDTHWTTTTEYADVVLPAPTYLEKDDLVLSWSHPYVRLSPQVVEPVTDSRSEVWVMQALARRLGRREPYLYEDPWPVLATMFADAFLDGDFQDLRAGRLLTLKRKAPDRYPTASGKFEFFSTRAVVNGFDPLPHQPEISVETGAFVLLTSATPNYTSTQFQDIYGPIPAVVQMHPRDAARLAIADGQVINLSNAYGTMQMIAAISENVPEGVLWAPRQSEDAHGMAQNSLMTSIPQAIGKGPRFNSTTVTVTAAAGHGD